MEAASPERALATSEVRGRERSGRIRDLLKDYYDAEEDGRGSLHTQQSSVDPCDIDGASFDVEQYMEEAMQGERMKQMLEKTSNIRGEVKQLDNDMQMLVYENYTKFIKATDTIGRMRDEGALRPIPSLKRAATSIATNALAGQLRSEASRSDWMVSYLPT